MECERCGGDVDRYRLQGHEAGVCRACGFVGVPVEHRRESGPSESWSEAFDRFYEKTDAEPAEDHPARPVGIDDASARSEPTDATDAEHEREGASGSGTSTEDGEESDGSPGPTENGDDDGSVDPAENGDDVGGDDADDTVLSLNGNGS